MNLIMKYTCTICNKEHDDLPSLGFNSPYYYDILNQEDKENIVLKNEDFCRIEHSDQTDYFVRSVFQIPIIDHEETLDYGVWVSVSEKTFKEYFIQYEEEKPEEKDYFSRIANEIKDYETSTLSLQMQLTTQLGSMRPLLAPYESDHAFVQDWLNGITMDEAEKRIAKTYL